MRYNVILHYILRKKSWGILMDFSIPISTNFSIKGHKEWVAETYHTHSQIQYRLARDLLQRYFSSIGSFSGNEKILDLGCGDGKVTKEIADQVTSGSVLGIDYSPSMIDFARSTYPAKIYSNLEFEQRDAVSFVDDQKFDIVFSFCCLHWIENQGLVLRNIYQSLKPGGIFLQLFPTQQG